LIGAGPNADRRCDALRRLVGAGSKLSRISVTAHFDGAGFCSVMGELSGERAPDAIEHAVVLTAVKDACDPSSSRGSGWLFAWSIPAGHERLPGAAPIGRSFGVQERRRLLHLREIVGGAQLRRPRLG
jgi:hypothetical protein